MPWTSNNDRSTKIRMEIIQFKMCWYRCWNWYESTWSFVLSTVEDTVAKWQHFDDRPTSHGIKWAMWSTWALCPLLVLNGELALVSQHFNLTAVLGPSTSKPSCILLVVLYRMFRLMGFLPCQSEVSKGTAWSCCWTQYE